MKIDFKDKKGFTAIDLSIAMIVIIIFVVIMTSVSYNVYLSSIEAKRTAVALNYAVDIFEHIGTLNMDDVANSDKLFEIDSLAGITDISTSEDTSQNTNHISATLGTYSIELEIKDYKGDGKVKIIALTIKFPVSKKNTESVEMSRVKVINSGG